MNPADSPHEPDSLRLFKAIFPHHELSEFALPEPELEEAGLDPVEAYEATLRRLGLETAKAWAVRMGAWQPGHYREFSIGCGLATAMVEEIAPDRCCITVTGSDLSLLDAEVKFEVGRGLSGSFKVIPTQQGLVGFQTLDVAWSQLDVDSAEFHILKRPVA